MELLELKVGRTYLVFRFIQGRRGDIIAEMDASERSGIVGKRSMIISGRRD
jgi:hypothetical protein